MRQRSFLAFPRLNEHTLSMLPDVTYHRPHGLPGLELFHARSATFRHKPHFHEAWTFWFNPQGAEQYIRRGGTTILQPGSFSIIPPGEVHENFAVSDSRRLMSFYVDEDVMQDLQGQMGGDANGSALEFTIVRDPGMVRSLTSLHKLLNKTRDPMAGQSAFLSVFSELFRRHGVQAVREGNVDSDPGRIEAAIAFLRAKASESVGLDALAVHCQCTPRHLTRLFRNRLGITPHAYLVGLRLEHARKLIREGRPLHMVAAESGFADQSHLTRHFRVRYGTTPAVYASAMSVLF